MDPLNTHKPETSSRGIYINTGNGANLIPVDINHDKYMVVINPDNAFWALVQKDQLADTLIDSAFIAAYKSKAKEFLKEINTLRFGISLSAVYINPTSRCNLNCSYCYIPEEMRSNGTDISKDNLFNALQILDEYFKTTLPKNRKAQIIFHGAEPLIVKDTVFSAIEKFKNNFIFGIQTNGTLLDDKDIEFLKQSNINVGLSLDASEKEISDKTRKTWNNEGVFDKTLAVIEKFKGYHAYNVICTISKENMNHLVNTIEFFHKLEVPAVLMNIIRCTLPKARELKPEDHKVAKHFIDALDKSYSLYKETGRKIIIGNFANILVSILAPMARRLMCDISPCGGGRAFFALAPDGSMFPCSEFIGLPEFNGGNLFNNSINDVLKTNAFLKVTDRKIENIHPCNKCVIRHYCGSPCPAEAHEMNYGMHNTGAFCEFYEEQVRYAFRLIADGIHENFLWDNWDKDTKITFDYHSN